jgi:hypothetical protein
MTNVPIKMIRTRPTTPTIENTTPERTLFWRNPVGACVGANRAGVFEEPGGAVTVKVCGELVTCGVSVEVGAGVVLVSELEVVVVLRVVDGSDEVELEVVVEVELVELADVVVDDEVEVGLPNGLPGVNGPDPKMSGIGRVGNCLPSNCTMSRYWAPIKVAGEGE